MRFMRGRGGVGASIGVVSTETVHRWCGKTVFGRLPPQHNATEAGVRELRRSGTSIHGKHLSERDTKKTKVMITDGSMILSRFGLDYSVVLYPDRCNSWLVSVGWPADCRWLASYGRIARQDWQGCAELGWLASLAGGMGLAGLGSWAGVGWNRCRT